MSFEQAVWRSAIQYVLLMMTCGSICVDETVFRSTRFPKIKLLRTPFDHAFCDLFFVTCFMRNYFLSSEFKRVCVLFIHIYSSIKILKQ